MTVGVTAAPTEMVLSTIIGLVGVQWHESCRDVAWPGEGVELLPVMMELKNNQSVIIQVSESAARAAQILVYVAASKNEWIFAQNIIHARTEPRSELPRPGKD